LRVRSPRFVGERHAIEAHNLDRNVPNHAGPVDVSKLQADVRVRRGIDEAPKLFPVGSKADLGQAAGRVSGVADRDPVDAQIGLLLPLGGCRALNFRGCVDALVERALRQLGGAAESRHAGSPRRGRRLRMMDLARRIDR
jgi:hypothetical protein